MLGLRRCMLLLATPGALAVAQAPATSPSADAQIAIASQAAKARGDERAEWLLRATRYTAAIQDDQFRLPRRERLILPGRLAALWWKSNPKPARAWLENAIADVEFAPDQESDDDLKARLGAARVLLNITAPLDRSLSDRALKVVTEGEQRQKGRLSSRDRFMMAHDLADAAGEIAQSDPDRALDLARQLLTMKWGGIYIEDAYINLNGANPERGAQFLREAIAATRTGYDPEMVEGLMSLVEHAPTGSELPDDQRAAVLGVIAEAMLRPDQSEEDQRNMCRMSAKAAGLQFPPEIAGAVRAAIEICRAKMSPVAEKILDSELAGSSSRTPDELIRAAADENDAGARGILKAQAAVILEPDDPIRALDILDGLTADERKRIGLGMRSMYAQRALDAAYKAHDTAAMQRILDRTPDQERPQLLINMASTAFRAKDDTLGLAFLSQARATLDTWEPRDNWRPFTMLVNLYAENMPTETTHVLAEAMKGINRVKPRDPHDPNRSGIVIMPLGDELRPVDLNPAVLDADSEYVAASFKQLDDVAGRTALRLALVRACLRRYEMPPTKEKRKPAVTPRANDAAKDKK